MQCLAPLCFAALLAVLPAARPLLQYVHRKEGNAAHGKKVEADGALTPEEERGEEAVTRLDASEAHCPSAGALRTIMQQLGIPAAELTGDPDTWEGIYLSSEGCVWNLDLEGRNVSGGLDPLRNLTDLRHLFLRHTKVGGRLEPLRQMKKLRVLWLAHTLVEGGLEPLRNLTDLHALYLSHTKVGGRLEPLRQMTQLAALRLDHTLVEGGLEPLRNLTDLQVLYLSHTKVGGRLEPLRQMKKLRVLWLDHTLVEGGLEPLRNLTDLQKLSLSQTKVGVRLEPLRQMKELYFLNLRNTHVSGSIELVKNLSLLKTLLFAGSRVEGDFGQLIHLENLREADLSNTRVHGRLTASWQGKLRGLRTLKLAGSRVNFLPVGGDLDALRSRMDFRGPLLPALMDLDVSNCPLDGDVQHLLVPLLVSEHLAQLRANAANLSGELMDIGNAPLMKSLQALELADNRITHIAGFNARVFVSLANGSDVSLDRRALLAAVKKNLQVDLTATRITNTEDITALFADGTLKATAQRTQTNLLGSFSCIEITSTSLRVSPPLFWPEGLCACNEGFQGSGTSCHKCERGRYNEDFNSSCKPCPSNSSTMEAGTTSVNNCICQVGRIYKDKSGNHSCQCDAMKALYQNSCEDCGKLHLDCHEAGLLASSAQPQVGYARLAEGAPNASRCLEPAGPRCNVSTNGTSLGCAAGHEGPLCVACSKGYQSRAGSCIPCALGSDTSARWFYLNWLAGGAVVVAMLGTSFLLWQRSRQPAQVAEPVQPPAELPVWNVMQPLLAAQGPLLLQLFQLWGLLVALRPVQGTKRDGNEGVDVKMLWVEEYVRLFQLTAEGLRDAISLECWWGARTASSFTALVGPCVPLALLLLCVVPEVASHGTGVSRGLKLLTLLYIGGASSCAALMRCQDVDGGKEPLGDFAFRAALPDIKCQEPFPLADGIAWICTFCYGLLIPSFLAYLMFKQHLALAPSRRFVTLAKRAGGSIAVWVLPVQESDGAQLEDTKDDMKTKSLLAAAVAHSCIFFTGSVRVQLRDERLILQPAREQGDSERLDLDASSLVWKALQSKSDADLRRCQALARMLMERCVLEDVARSDRVVAGAKELFMKYAACQNVWFEIAMRIVVVALVTAIGSEHGLEFVLGFTLCTAVAVGTLRPFRQHQVNDLQCLCFLCLAMAAAGFSKGLVFMPRAALVVPCVVAGLQALWPDGPEALALRLFKEFEGRWPALQQGETVELSLQSIRVL